MLHKNSKINLVIPMAGLGTRFSKVGYTDPKPLIKFLGKTMVEHVVDAFPVLSVPVHKIFLVLKEHDEKYNVGTELQQIYPGCSIVIIDQVTEGAACTVLLAKHLIDNDDVLAIMNSDNIIEWDKQYLISLHYTDGAIATFEDPTRDPKWSYANVINEDTLEVSEVVEKQAVSTHATAGLYFWKMGSQFVEAAELMIEKNLRVNNEFYVAPVYTQNVALGHKVTIFPVDAMHGVGTPRDLLDYIDLVNS